MGGSDVKRFLLLLLIFCLWDVSENSRGNEGIVVIGKGTIEGIKMYSENKNVFYGYYGIPYAQPPVNKLRFKDPIKHHGWKYEVRIGKNPPPMCPQWIKGEVVGDENCLYVNVFSPRLRPTELQPYHPLLPVMVYIHGGGFFRGGMNKYGPEKLMDEHKVLVFVQYRLGALGFLSTEDDNFPGNYGMRDVILALQWVQKYIRNFGGDKDQVTVFGNGAGGAAVSMLMVSPLAKDLFSAAIVQSGSAFCDWSIEPNPTKFATSLAEALDCPHENKTAMYECMQNRHVIDIVEKQTRIQRKSFLSVMKPVVDKRWRSSPFLPAHPIDLYKDGEFFKIPLMAGVTTDEGLNPLHWFQIRQHTLLRNGTKFDREYMPQMMDAMMDDKYDAKTLWDISKSIYFRDISLNKEEELLQPLVELLGDAMVYHCMDNLLRYYSAKVPGKTFAYVFGIRNYANYDDESMNFHVNDFASSYSNKVGKQAIELPYIFEMNSSISTNSISLKPQYNVAELWSNFAIYGEPTPEFISKGKIAIWLPYSQKNQNFYHLQQVFSQMPYSFRHRELATWNHLLSEAEAAAEAIRWAELNKDPFQPYRAVMWAMIAVAGFLMVVVIVFAAILVNTGKKGSDPIKPFPVD